MENSLIKKIKILVTICIIAMLSACNESFLDLAPISQANVNSFYKTQSDFETAIVSVYDSWQNIVPGDWTRMTEFRGDTYHRFNYVEYEISSNIWLLNSTLSYWKNFYKVVSNANIILDKIDNINSFEETTKNRIKAEARFFRAEAYFALVRFFGAVPLVKHEINSIEALDIGRTDVFEIYNLIEDDFKFAIDNLPEIVSDQEYGRVTKYAAEGELARVFITLSGKVYNQNRWAEAKPLLEDILFNSPYEFAETYQEIFADDGSNEKGKEIIFSILFKAGNEGEATSYANAFIGKFGEVARHVQFENGLVESYESGDIRKDVNIVDNYLALDINQWIDGHWINVKFDYLYDIGSKNSGMDWPMLRYTDAYLLYAEALAEISGNVPEQSLEILNKVRNRAGLNLLTQIDIPDINAFRMAMEKERRCELMFECVRWFDLVRTGRAVEVLNALGKNADDTWLLFPIPQSEIDKVGSDILPQNPGY
ncbi:RagB/SusD family nutrient uptake outer membrane protein [Maribellus comscasis]|uniref:RagB/SusD family nutrient uptake outer membrane protein n=1 Tax=Maribellus comscasis TaxID=2681766 RepID=A0A6I6JNC2_9BACT|nr:RagB/SusD family nutrient uptake outer membrane protein [Maribellus comscasis]QGY42568.1 RagB/SusD family nutrient uptake outer membrane protein [Maribellus comscasis]